MEKFVGYVEYRNEEYEVMYDDSNADVSCRRRGSGESWYPCKRSANDTWQNKTDVLQHLASRDNNKYVDSCKML